MTTWDQALDRFAAALAEQRVAAAQDEPELLAYSPPDDLGPLPARLAARARSLLAEAEQLTELLRTRSRGVQREIALLARHRPEAAAPSFLDQAL